MADSPPIAGMFSLFDRDENPVCDCLEGDVPIIISAPHAGRTEFADGSVTHRNPPGVKRFGKRQRDPSDPTLPGAWFSVGNFNPSSGDTNTRHIAFGIVRRLISLNMTPYAVINRVNRQNVDLARPWELQHHWLPDGSNNPLTPAQVEARDPDFRRDYHSRYHDILASFVRRVHPQEGWLFDIHGQKAVNRVVLSTTAGWMARSDWMYLDGATSFFGHLQAQNLDPVPASRRSNGLDGSAVNFIPGLLHGATDPFDLSRPVPSKLEPVIPAPDRVHAVHVEIEGLQRIPTSGTKEEQIMAMENLGTRVGDAIHRFLSDHEFIHVTRNVNVSWMTSRIEYETSAREMERVFFEASDDHRYYLGLETQNRSTELVAVSLIQDAFNHRKRLNLWWVERKGRRWLKAVNLHD